MAGTILGSGLALMVLAMPQPSVAPMPLIPAHAFDLAALPIQPDPDNLPETAIDAEKEGIKGGQWDELPRTNWSYRTSESGPALELGTGGGRIKPLRHNRPKQRDGRLAHVSLGWDF